MSTQLLFPGFYAQTIFTFVIPEYAGARDNVNKHFKMDEILDKLRKGISLSKPIRGFKPAQPAFNFKNIQPTGYEERFWHTFWRQAPHGLPAHFPVVMTLKGNLSRSFNSSAAGGPQGKIPLAKYKPTFRCYFFPYGAISLRFAEEVDFAQGSTSQQIVDFLDSDVIRDGKVSTLESFFQQLREAILSDVLRKRQNFQYSGTSPQYYIVNPVCGKRPDANQNWRDISILLAMSGRDSHLAKYDTATYGTNYGKTDQLILIGPRSCVVFAPKDTFHKPANGPGCLRNRLANLSDLCITQQAFIDSFTDDYQALLSMLKSMNGRPTAQINQLIRDTFSYRIGDSIGFLGLLMQLQNPMINNTTKDKDVDRWYQWYSAVLATRKTTFVSFGSLLNELAKANVQLGDDVRGMLSGALKAVTGLISSLKG